MRVSVRQISGLGNQLFQYAAGLYFAELYGAELEIIVDPSIKAFSHGSPRPFLLDRFSITAPRRAYTAKDRLLLSERLTLTPIIFATRRLMHVRSYKETFSKRYEFLSRLPFTFDSKTLERLYLFGYWQSYRYAAAVEQTLRTQFRLRDEPVGRTAEVLAQIRETRTAVSLHVRRGDFTLAAEGNIALPMDFYRRAIARMLEKHPEASFFVFSDDIPWVRENLPRGLDAVFVDHNDATTAQEDLRLMSACKHHILANSTFSWWGAWLNAAAEKDVIAPKQWLLKPGSYYPELMPPEWELLDVHARAEEDR